MFLSETTPPPFAPLAERLAQQSGSVHYWIEFMRRNHSDGQPSIQGLADAADTLEAYIGDLQRERSELAEEVRELRSMKPRHG